MPSDLRSAHRQALDAATAYVEAVSPADLGRPTPCAGWDLADLLAHMVGQHRGFTAALLAGDAPAAAYAPEPWTPAAWHDSVDALVAAFAGADLAAPVVQVELAPTALPVSVLLAAQHVDTVVHTWDVARTLGRTFAPPAAVVAIVEEVLPLVPDDEGRTRPGAAFAPALASDGDAWARVLAWLGRDPAWSG